MALRAARLPLLVGGGAVALTAFGLFAIANDYAVAQLRAHDRARELVRATATALGAELDRLAADPAGLAPSTRGVLLAFRIGEDGKVDPPPRRARRPEAVPIDERVRVETLLDEAAYRETTLGDAASAATVLDRARDAATDARLAAQVALARGSFALRRGDPRAAIDATRPLAEGDAVRTARQDLPARALARLLVARALVASGDASAADAARGAIAEARELDRAAGLAFLDDVAELGVLDAAEIEAARASVDAEARREDLLRRLEAAGGDLLGSPGRVPVGDALAVLAERDERGRAGALVDAAELLAGALPKAGSLAGVEGVPVVADGVEAVEIPGSAGLARVGLPRGFAARDPGAGTRAAALGALVVLLGATIAAGALVTARAARREIEAARAKSEFLAGVTHELKTPLTAIRLYGELLEEGRAGDERKRRDYLRTICRESERLTALIDRVLSLARLERGGVAPPVGPVRADRLVADAASAFRPIADRAEVALDVSVRDGECELAVDAPALVQVVLDLLDNAVKYAADGGAVELRAFRTGARYAIEVADRGPGFDEADRERLFGLFERGASSAAREKPGLGIGLALSRRIVEANRGLLTARRRDGGGSVFAIEAPIAGVDA